MIRMWNINRTAVSHFDGKLPKWLRFDLCSDLFVHSLSSSVGYTSVLFEDQSACCRRSQTSGKPISRVLTGQFGDHFRELATGAVGGIRQAKILEDLQKSLLLIKKAEMFPGAIGLAKEPLADDRQSPIA